MDPRHGPDSLGRGLQKAVGDLHVHLLIALVDECVDNVLEVEPAARLSLDAHAAHDIPCLPGAVPDALEAKRGRHLQQQPGELRLAQTIGSAPFQRDRVHVRLAVHKRDPRV